MVCSLLGTPHWPKHQGRRPVRRGRQRASVPRRAHAAAAAPGRRARCAEGGAARRTSANGSKSPLDRGYTLKAVLAQLRAATQDADPHRAAVRPRADQGDAAGRARASRLLVRRARRADRLVSGRAGPRKAPVLARSGRTTSAAYHRDTPAAHSATSRVRTRGACCRRPHVVRSLDCRRARDCRGCARRGCDNSPLADGAAPIEHDVLARSPSARRAISTRRLRTGTTRRRSPTRSTSRCTATTT